MVRPESLLVHHVADRPCEWLSLSDGRRELGPGAGSAVAQVEGLAGGGQVR